MSNENKVDKVLQMIAKLSIDESSQVLSKMIKSGASITLEDVYMTDITSVTEKIMTESADEEVVGVFIDLVGDAPFKFLFYVDTKDCFLLTDMILRKEIGTTKELDLYSQSAVQEIGNIISSAISNVFAGDFQIVMKPKPPIVVNDYASSLFQEFIVGAVQDKNDVLLIESKFMVVSNNINCRMFLMPEGESDKFLSYISNVS